jgi:hypothetical protein
MKFGTGDDSTTVTVMTQNLDDEDDDSPAKLLRELKAKVKVYSLQANFKYYFNIVIRAIWKKKRLKPKKLSKKKRLILQISGMQIYFGFILKTYHYLDFLPNLRNSDMSLREKERKPN